jgi:hypothetical protein
VEIAIFTTKTGMKRPKYSLAYIQALQTYARVVSQSKIRKANHVLASGSVVTTTQEGTESYSSEEIAISDSHILGELTVRGLKMYARIMSELKFNNALWYFDHTTNNRDTRVIKELREKGLLLPTEDIRIHYVNPDKLRKGNKLLVAANTAAVTATGKVERAMIKPLNKKNIQINPMHLLELTSE